VLFRSQAGELFRKLPDELQLSIYDDLLRAARSNRYLTEVRFKRLFPEPPGLKEWRKLVGSNLEKSDRSLRKQLQFEQQ